MGCVVTRPPEAHLPNIKTKFHARTYNSANDSTVEWSQKLGVDQQANQLGTSPSQSQLIEGSLKRTQTIQSHRSLAKKLDLPPRLRLPSPRPSLQDLSAKGSLDGSFDKDKEKEIGQSHSPRDNPTGRVESYNFKLRGSTPSFSRPSGFKAGTPSLYSNPESVPRDRDQNPWSLQPLKDSNVSPSEASDTKERRGKNNEKSGSEDKEKEKRADARDTPELLFTVTKADSMELEAPSKKEVNNESRHSKETRSSIESSSGIRIRNINQKFQKILLNDSTPTPKPRVSSSPHNSTTNLLPRFGSPLSKAPLLSSGGTGAVNQTVTPDGSPPKTLNFLDVPFANDSYTKKSLDLPDQTLLSASTMTMNINSIGTISNLVSLCKDKDGKKRENFDKKFRMNLVDLIKDAPSPTKPKEDSVIVNRTHRKLVQVATSYPDQFRNPLDQDRHRPSIDKQLIFNNNLAAGLESKSSYSNNLLSLVKEDQPKKPIRTHHKHKSMQINLNNEDLFDDFMGSSPVDKVHPKDQKESMRLLPFVSHLNLSMSKNSDSGYLQEKTICNFDEQASRMDWAQYSICEQINNVEIDDRSMIMNNSHLDVGSLTRIEGLDAQTPLALNTSVNGDFLDPKQIDQLQLTKTRSAPNGETAETLGQTKSPPTQGPPGGYKFLNDSISTIQYLSPIQGPRALAQPPVQKLQTGGGSGKKIHFGRADSQVVETNRVDKSVDEEGQKKINQYILIKEVGRGGFGKVKLAINAETKKQHAIKIANKKKMKRKLLTRQKSAYNQLASEIAIMKKMDHPNVVKLFEVIDDPNNDKLYIVMEYVKRGAVMSRNYWRSELKNAPESEILSQKIKCLTEEKAKKYFRHLVLSLDYLHNYAEIIHRDIKPENLLINEEDVLKVSDFGISKIIEEGDDMLGDNAGTKYYLPPEAWGAKTFHGKPTDIWAAGGTLFYFLVGKPPFQANDAQELKRKVQDEELSFEGLNLNPKVVNLIQGCLIKDPFKRITLEEIMEDPWLTDDGKNPLTNDGCTKLEVTEEEMNKALTRVKFMAAIMVTAKLKRNLTITRRRIERRKTQEVSQMMKDSEGNY